MPNSRHLNVENQSIVTGNYTVPYYQTLKKSLDPEPEKTHKMTKIFRNVKKLQKLVSFCLFVFVLPKHIAHKMVITSNFVSQKAFINF